MKKYGLILGAALMLTTALSSVAFAASSGSGAIGSGAYQGSPIYSAPLQSFDQDNNIGNANQTGQDVTDDTGASRDNVIKSRDMVKNDGTTSNQRTHGEYQNNTNSCASCHQTHTAAAKSLLFKSGVYATCTACHDGTLGFYNVFGTGAGLMGGSTAGTFGGNTDGNASVHLADGTQKISAAPGGKKGGTEGTWGADFNCAQCHAPHGSYSDRLLHYNPNNVGNTDQFLTTLQGGVASSKVTTSATLDLGKATERIEVKSQTTSYAKDGITGVALGLSGTALTNYNPLTYKAIDNYILDKLFVDYKDVAKTDTNTYTKVTSGGYKLVGLTAVDKGAAVLADTITPSAVELNYIVKSTVDQEGIAGEAPGTPVVVLYKQIAKLDAAGSQVKDGAGNKIYTYVRDTNPWLYGYDRITVNGKTVEDEWTKFKSSTGAVIEVESKNGLAYAKEAEGAVVADIASGDVAPATVVKLGGNVLNADGTVAKTLPMTEIFDFGGVSITKVQSDVYDEVGFGVGIGKYCGACHTDYRAKSGAGTGVTGTDGTGVWSKAFRHTTNNDSYTCLKCHFAHGTDVTVMSDAKDQTLATLTAAGAKYDGNTAGATAYLLDKNPSSALKRYTNMAVCWKCHTSSKATQLKNNGYYWNNPDAPHGPSNW